MADGVLVKGNFNIFLMNQQVAIGLDLGATRLKGVLLELDTGQILNYEMVETKDADQWKAAVREMVEKLGGSKVYVGIGIAAPGLTAENARAITCMPGRMEGLEGFDWQDFLGSTVKVINDAHAAITAEVNYGVAKNLKNVIMLTLGTGVGGGIWLNGKLHTGTIGRGGHMGHMSLDVNHPQRDITKIPGSLEDLIGDATVTYRSYGRYKDTRELVEAYRKQEPFATWVWLHSIRNLAAGVASLINIFSPDMVVLGGGITSAEESLFKPLETFLDLFEWRPMGGTVTIRKAHFAEWSGAVGAAAQFNV